LLVDEVEASEVYGEELKKRSDLEILEGPKPMAFDRRGNLLPLIIHGGARKGDL
jgi:hypothetical protein